CRCGVPCFCFSSRRRHTRFSRDWSSDVCSSDLSLFRHREGDIAYVASANGGGYIVFNVTGIDTPEFNPDSAEPNALRQQLNAAGVQDFLQQYLVALQEEIGITINEQLWRRLQGRPE